VGGTTNRDVGRMDQARRGTVCSEGTTHFLFNLMVF
jgi:hypothetical protein